MQHYNQMTQPITITNHSKEAIIAEMQEVIKIMSVDLATTAELEKASTKTRFISRLINLYLDDAFGEISTRYRQPMFGSDPQFRQWYPQGYNPMTGMPYQPMHQSILEPLAPLQGAFNASLTGQGVFGGGQPTVMNNFMSNPQQPLNQDHTFGTRRPLEAVQWNEFSDTVAVCSEVRPLNGSNTGAHTLVIKFAEKPSVGGIPVLLAEVDMFTRNCTVINGPEVLTIDRVKIDPIRDMLTELLNDYIIGDKSLPQSSPQSVHLWNAVKAQEPNHYKEWNILNINGEQIGHLNLVDDQQD